MLGGNKIGFEVCPMGVGIRFYYYFFKFFDKKGKNCPYMYA